MGSSKDPPKGMGSSKDPPKGMNPPKKQDPPKGGGGEAHMELSPFRMGSADPSEGSGRGNQVLPALRSAGVDRPMGAGGRGHQVHPGSRSGSVESIADESNWALHALPTDESVTHPNPLHAERITVGTAKRIMGPAHEALIGLSIPNDLSEAHRELFLELLRSIKDLQKSLADFKDENRRLSDEPEEFRKKLVDAIPLWKRAWETFVLKGAEVAGGGAVFTAGFIAGATYSAFTAEAPGTGI